MKTLLIIFFFFFHGCYSTGTIHKDIQIISLSTIRPHVEEQVWLIASGKLPDKDIARLIKIMNCESRMGSWMINVNKNGTIDRGYLMFNNKYQPQVSLACADDLECSVNQAIILIKKNHGFNAWQCNKLI